MPSADPRRAARTAAWIEGGALAGAWLLLLGLLRTPSTLSFEGVFGQPVVSVSSAVVALVAAPGFVWWRWLIAGPARHAPAWSLGLGLAWLLLPCTAAMMGGASPGDLLHACVALNGALTAGHIVLRVRGVAPPAAKEPERAGPGLWLPALAVLVVARLLDESTRRVQRFTHGGDEWLFMKAIRSFLELPSVADPAEFDVWDLALSLLVRLSGVEVVTAYRAALPPLLVLAAALAFLALAEELLEDRGQAWLALSLLGIYALTDMHTRGEGMGMILLVRVAEDKAVALLLALPLAQAAFLRALRGSGRPLVALGVLALGAALLQPFAVPWLALTCGATYLVAAATRRVPSSRRGWMAVGGLLAVGLVVAWVLRALRPSSYFLLYDPGWGFNATLLELSFRQLLILDLQRGWYMGHPWLLSHPLVMAALLGSLTLLPALRRSLSAQWLVVCTWVPVLIVFTPLTAVLAGRLVTPWRLYRLLWVMPVALVLGAVVGRAVRALHARFTRGRTSSEGWTAVPAALAMAVLTLCWAALSPWADESERAFRARNRVLVKPGEMEFLHEVSGYAAREGLGGTVLAPEGVSIRLPSWTTRLRAVPGLEAIRNRDEVLRARVDAFYGAASLGGPEVALLLQQRVAYVLTDVAAPVDGALRAHPAAFRPLLRGSELALYEWQPERWTATPLP